MKPDERFAILANEEMIIKAINSLKANGIDAILVDLGVKAKEKLFELLPSGVEVMNMTSMTLEAIGADKEINESGNYDSVRNKLNKMDRETQGVEMQKMGSAPDWVVGSVHAVTQEGDILIASATGSQLPAYAYGANHVIWVVGAQKIVKDFDEAIERLYDYTFPLEDERAMKAYGMHSGVNKKLIISKEVIPNRIHMIIVRENLGF